MGALLRQPPKQHAEMKVTKKPKKAKAPKASGRGKAKP